MRATGACVRILRTCIRASHGVFLQAPVLASEMRNASKSVSARASQGVFRRPLRSRDDLPFTVPCVPLQDDVRTEPWCLLQALVFLCRTMWREPSFTGPCVPSRRLPFHPPWDGERLSAFRRVSFYRPLCSFATRCAYRAFLPFKHAPVLRCMSFWREPWCLLQALVFPPVVFSFA